MPLDPIAVAKAGIRRSRRLLATAEAELPDSKVKNDLRRLAIVTAVAGIDAYMHWQVYTSISRVGSVSELPPSLANLDLQVGDLAELADAVIEARRHRAHVLAWEHVALAVQQRLLRETFQSFDQIGRAFAMAGVAKGWARVSDKLTIPASVIKQELNKITQRRNQIVHEGDIARSPRPRKLEYNGIDHQTVIDTIDWIDALVGAMDEVFQDGSAEL
jgi:hypothetical protein